LNKLSTEAGLSLGQRLLVKPGPTQPAVAAAAASSAADSPPSAEASAVVKYQVREGDSLWTISLKFKVTIEQLLAWNNLTPDPILQPGQELVLYKTS
jgi:peptidoglycan endopeptidase LytE